MRSGKMRYRVRVQRPKRDDERRGGKVVWENVHIGPEDADGKCWAYIRQRRVVETEKKKQLAVVGHFEIRCWAIPEINETWRFVHGSSIYNIKSIDDPVLTSRELVIICKRDKLKGETDAS